VLRARQRPRRGPLAYRRSAAVLAAQINATAQPRPCFPRLATAGVTRVRDRSCSGAPRGPVIVPAEPMPGPPGGRVTSPTRRNRTRPVSRSSPVTSLRGRDSMIVAEDRTNVKEYIQRPVAIGAVQ
jgi:hypothetical protein